MFVHSCSFNRLSNRVVQPVWLSNRIVQPIWQPAVHTIQPVVKPDWQPVVSCIRPFNWLSNGLSNRFENRLYRVYSRLYNAVWQSNRLYNAVWQPVERTAVRSTQFSNRVWQQVDGLSNRVWQPVERTAVLATRLPVWQPAVRVYKHSTRCQTSLTTALTTGWMFVYTIQPVVKPVWQPVVSYKWGLTNNCCCTEQVLGTNTQLTWKTRKSTGRRLSQVRRGKLWVMM